MVSTVLVLELFFNSVSMFSLYTFIENKWYHFYLRFNKDPNKFSFWYVIEK